MGRSPARPGGWRRRKAAVSKHAVDLDRDLREVGPRSVRPTLRRTDVGEAVLCEHDVLVRSREAVTRAIADENNRPTDGLVQPHTLALARTADEARRMAEREAHARTAGIDAVGVGRHRQ